MVDNEFKRLVLKSLRTLIRAQWLHNPSASTRETDAWDWHKELGGAEQRLIDAEAELEKDGTAQAGQN